MSTTTMRYLILFFLTSPLWASTNNLQKTPDLYNMSLEELLNIEINAGSHFSKSKAETSHSISQINKTQWELWGSQNMYETLQYSSGVQTIPTIFGGTGLAIRGYADGTNIRSHSTLIDNIPLNGFILSGSQYTTPKIGLGVLQSIELIKGSASTFYGSEAFHGVLSTKTYEGKNKETIFKIAKGSFGHSQFYQNGHYKLSPKLSLDTAISIDEIQDKDLIYYNTSNGNEANNTFKDGHLNLSGKLQLNIEHSAYNKTKFAFYNIDHSFDEHHGFAGSKTTGNQGFAEGRILTNIYSVKNTNTINSRFELQSQFYHVRQIYLHSFQTNIIADSIPGHFDKTNDVIHDYDQTRSSINLILKKNKGPDSHEYSVDYRHTEFYVNHAKVKEVGQIERVEYPFHAQKRNLNSMGYLGRYHFLNSEINYGGRLDTYSDIGTHFSPKMAYLHYNNKNTYKLIYNHAFRAPSAQERSGYEPNIDPNKNLSQSTIDNYEFIFLRMTKNYHFELTLFQSEFNDGVELDISKGTPYQYINIAKGKSYGIEIATKYNLSPKYTLNIETSYVRSIKTNDNNQEYRAFPRLILAYRLNYNLNDNKNFFIGARHQNDATGSPTSSNQTKEKVLPNYVRLDAGTRITINRYDLSMSIKNITNTRNRTPSPWSAIYGYTDYGTNAMIGLKTKF